MSKTVLYEPDRYTDFSKNDVAHILKFLENQYKINLNDVQDDMRKEKRKEIIEQHKYAISQGKDGNWRTYLPDEVKGRKMIKKSTREAVENAVVKYYEEVNNRPKTFDEMYKHWRTIQDKLVSDNTTEKYNSDYIRYFKDTEFAQKEIISITEEDIIVFIVDKVQELKLCKKACKTLYGYLKNTIKSAKINRVIKEDPMEFIESKQFYKYCFEKNKTPESQTFSDYELELILGQIKKDNLKQPEYIPVYALHLAMLTGMRVGELSALSWDRITDEYIIIDRSEKYNKKTKKYFIDTTKTGKSRCFPITDEIRELLNRIKKVEAKYGYFCEWVFANENGRIHTSVLLACIKNKCIQLKIPQKGIHAFRRTLNSKMRCSGTSSTVAASLLGHSKEVNEQYYTFDITDIREKVGIISAINKKIV